MAPPCEVFDDGQGLHNLDHVDDLFPILAATPHAPDAEEGPVAKLGGGRDLQVGHAILPALGLTVLVCRIPTSSVARGKVEGGPTRQPVHASPFSLVPTVSSS